LSEKCARFHAAALLSYRFYFFKNIMKNMPSTTIKANNVHAANKVLSNNSSTSSSNNTTTSTTTTNFTIHTDETQPITYEQFHPDPAFKELNVFVDDLLHQMESRFKDLENSLDTKMENMKSQLDSLDEQIVALMAQAGIESNTTTPIKSKPTNTQTTSRASAEL